MVSSAHSRHPGSTTAFGVNPVPMQFAAVHSVAEAAAHRHRKRAAAVKPAVTAAKVASIRDRYDGTRA